MENKTKINYDPGKGLAAMPKCKACGHHSFYLVETTVYKSDPMSLVNWQPVENHREWECENCHDRTPL